MPSRIQKCILCGKEFEAPNGFIKRCSDQHYSTCKVCGKQFPINCQPNQIPQTCSKECQNILTVRKRDATVKQRYGVDNVNQLQDVRNKLSKANRSDDVVLKRKATSLRNWGVDNPAKSEQVKSKLHTIMSSPEYLSSRAETCIDRYGYDSPMKCAEVKQARAKSIVDKYGVAGVPWSVDRYSEKNVDPDKVDNYLKFKFDPATYISEHFSVPPSIGTLKSELGVTDTPIYDVLLANNCINLLQHTHSSMEDQVVTFLRTVIPSAKIVRRDRTILSGQEIDIYLPEYSLGIECNPAATHNSSKPDPWGGCPKSYKYHQNKSILAQSKDVFLFHIFGYEWVNRRTIIESMLRNLVGQGERKINGRDTYVCELSGTECSKFLNDNHRQGNTNSKVRLGLRHKDTDELVSVMTFGHLRQSMGRKSTDDSTVWELSRFCSTLNTNVRGGAAKLLKAFVNKYDPSKIVSFSDVAHTTGKLYQKLGFHAVSTSAPSYVWTNMYDTLYYNRVSCQKRNLRNLLNDDGLDVDSQTEAEIMEAHDFVRLYDCGVVRWEYCTSVQHS